MLDTPTLKYGALAPNFELKDSAGTLITRSQYRNKSGLVLIFVPSTLDPAVSLLLAEVAADAEFYRKLNAKVYLISAQDGAAPLPTLIDSTGAARRAYFPPEIAGIADDAPAYGVFVLDRYGGVDSQSAGPTPEALRDAETIREWMQAAMYKCSI